MKISFILPCGGISGGVKSTLVVANALLEKGHDVRILINERKDNLRTFLRDRWLSLRYPHTSNWLLLFQGKTEMFRELTRCVFGKNEIVVASGSWACRELRKIDCDEIVKVHYIRGLLNDMNLMKETWCENVPKIASASYLADEMQKICKQKPVAIVPNGVNTNEYFPSVPADQRNGIGTIFGRTYHKDPATVVKVLSELQNIYPHVPQRIFSASRRPIEIPRKSFCRLPSIEKARDIYSRSLVWFVGSCSEGFSVPILEAMACGCAVVATDCGGPKDIITDGENGFLVEVGNVKEIIDRVKLLLKDTSLRQKFTENSKETVKRFTWSNSAVKLERVLEEIASRHLWL